MDYIIVPYDCSSHNIPNRSTEEMVMACMAKYLTFSEFLEWWIRRDIEEERRRLCIVCQNKCEICILRNVGLPML